MTATVEKAAAAAGAKAPNAEQELRTKIAALDRKIEAQRKHIDRLQSELSTKKTERAALVKQRIILLQQELPEDAKLDS